MRNLAQRRAKPSRVPFHRRKQAAFLRKSTKMSGAPSIAAALSAAVMALRSYECGNGSLELAKSIADAGDDALRAAGLPPATLTAASLTVRL